MDKFFDKFFTYERRLNRKPYILRIWILCVISLIIQLVLGTDSPLSLVITLPLTVSSIMMTIRRLHDTEHSGWWYLTMFIPIFNLYTLYLTIFKKGTEGYNSFGADPIVDGKGEDVL